MSRSFQNRKGFILALFGLDYFFDNFEALFQLLDLLEPSPGVEK